MKGLLPERYFAHGYITDDGIVVCGCCVASAQAEAAQNAIDRARFNEANFKPFNPGEGDNWCSICGADITNKWRVL